MESSKPTKNVIFKSVVPAAIDQGLALVSFEGIDIGIKTKLLYYMGF